MRRKSVLTSDSIVWSTRPAMADPPAALIIAAVSSIVSGRPYGDGRPVTLRPVQYTVAPASASARAMPRPAPRVAPATRATRPESGLRDDGFLVGFGMFASFCL